jgi:hypothetical protein
VTETVNIPFAVLSFCPFINTVNNTMLRNKQGILKEVISCLFVCSADKKRAKEKRLNFQ